MKTSLYMSATYEAPPTLKIMFPQRPAECDPVVANRSLEHGLEMAELAAELGFDWISVSQHHYQPITMTANPMVMAAALAERVKGVKIAILGALMPLLNPVRTAEEFALLDQITNGRVVAGMLRGTPNEFLTYGTNVQETRAKYEEGVELVLRALSEPEPFAWQGTHYSYRTVSVWPRPLQPHLPVMLSANSKESGTFAAHHHVGAGLSFVPNEMAGDLASHYRAECAVAGWQPEPDDIVYRGFIYVAETDAEAIAARQPRPAPVSDDGQSSRPEDITGRAASGKTGVLEATGQLMKAAVDGSFGTQFLGSPETVLGQLKALSERAGVGVVDLVFQPPGVSYEAGRRSLELFGREVLPHLGDL